MPEVKTRKKRRKKVRYREVRLKLTKNQQKSLDNYCKARRTTRTKLIKKMIRPFCSGPGLERDPVNDRSSQRNLISVFYVVANGNPTCYGG
jgi:hypothetical protein